MGRNSAITFQQQELNRSGRQYVYVVHIQYACTGFFESTQEFLPMLAMKTVITKGDWG